MEHITPWQRGEVRLVAANHYEPEPPASEVVREGWGRDGRIIRATKLATVTVQARLRIGLHEKSVDLDRDVVLDPWREELDDGRPLNWRPYRTTTTASVPVTTTAPPDDDTYDPPYWNDVMAYLWLYVLTESPDGGSGYAPIYEWVSPGGAWYLERGYVIELARRPIAGVMRGGVVCPS